MNILALILSEINVLAKVIPHKNYKKDNNKYNKRAFPEGGANLLFGMKTAEDREDWEGAPVRSATVILLFRNSGGSKEHPPDPKFC